MKLSAVGIETIFKAVRKPLLTDIGILPRLESCVLMSLGLALSS